MSKRNFVVVGILFLLIVSIILVSCQSSESKTGEITPPALSAEDQKILEQYPDDLDNSLKELEEVG